MAIKILVWIVKNQNCSADLMVGVRQMPTITEAITISLKISLKIFLVIVVPRINIICKIWKKCKKKEKHKLKKSVFFCFKLSNCDNRFCRV